METLKFLTLFSFFYFISQINSLSEWWEHTNAVELTNDNFFDYVGKDKYVIVKFFTKWCHYCKKMSPQYEKLHDYYQNKREDLIIARVECSENEYLALQYKIPSYPTVAMFYPQNLIKEHLMHKESNNTNLQYDEMDFVKKEILDLMTRTALLEKQIKDSLSAKKFLVPNKKPEKIHQNEVINKPKTHLIIKRDAFFSFPAIVAIALLISISVGGLLTLKRLLVTSNLKEN